MSAQFKAGFVALVGRPNVGKSTLLNALLGEKVAIVTPKPGTTRTRIHGILNGEGHQIAFVDTPGMASGKSGLHKAMRRIAGSAAADAEIALVIVEPEGEVPHVSKVDRELVQMAKQAHRRVVVAINKVDKVQPKQKLLPWIAAYAEGVEAEAIIPISARREDGLHELVDALLDRIPEGPALFPRDLHTDETERFLCQEFVREQLLMQTQQEVPHSCHVVIESFVDERDDERDNGGMCHLEGRIIVERESQKGIVIGKGGARIKSVSEKARHEIEELLGCKVFLRLKVHVDEHWRDNARSLREYGLDAQ